MKGVYVGRQNRVRPEKQVAGRDMKGLILSVFFSLLKLCVVLPASPSSSAKGNGDGDGNGDGEEKLRPHFVVSFSLLPLSNTGMCERRREAEKREGEKKEGHLCVSLFFYSLSPFGPIYVFASLLYFISPFAPPPPPSSSSSSSSSSSFGPILFFISPIALPLFTSSPSSSFSFS